jgi:acetate kinase
MPVTPMGGQSCARTGSVNVSKIPAILTLNSGSSSLKFAMFDFESQDRRLISGSVERIGLESSSVRIADGNGGTIFTNSAAIKTHKQALGLVLAQLGERIVSFQLVAVGHRVAHGGPECDCPTRVTPKLKARLKTLIHLAPLHLPANIAGINAVEAASPDLPQIACFDTTFHNGLPKIAQMTGLPRDLNTPEIRRYGYHGLSYEYIVSALRAEAVDVDHECILVLHLGNGASICAIREGKSVETTMGFSTVSGLPMGSRSGDIDPGLIDYLLARGRLDSLRLSDMLYSKSGLAGLSGISRNMADLLVSPELTAKEAIAYFCYHARRHLVGLTASLGGVDRVVFTGGIGTNAPAVRAAICEGLTYLGISLDPERNLTGDTVISSLASRVIVEARLTDEEAMIARHVRALTPPRDVRQKEAR